MYIRCSQKCTSGADLNSVFCCVFCFVFFVLFCFPSYSLRKTKKTQKNKTKNTTKNKEKTRQHCLGRPLMHMPRKGGDMRTDSNSFSKPTNYEKLQKNIKPGRNNYTNLNTQNRQTYTARYKYMLTTQKSNHKKQHQT